MLHLQLLEFLVEKILPYVGMYSHVHGTRMMDHGICWLTDGGNWDMRQNVRMEAIGNPAVRIKEAEFPIE